MRLFLVSSVIFVSAKACWPIMINVPAPVVHNECIQSGCESGHTCGRFGCARERKAFGVKSLKETAASNEDSITPMKHLTSTKNVAASMFQCCEDNLLPDGCLEKCSFAVYNKKTVRGKCVARFLDSDLGNVHEAELLSDAGPPCAGSWSANHQSQWVRTFLQHFPKTVGGGSKADLTGLHYCASRSRDHRSCCSRRGIPEHCQIFCGPPFDYSSINHQQLLCMEYLDTMKACFYEDFRREFVIRRRKLNAGKTFF